MRKRNLILIIFCSLMICLEGCMVGRYYFKTVKAPGVIISNKIKIAVIPENWNWTGTPSFLARAMVTELLELGFVVIERSALEKILGEQKLSHCPGFTRTRSTTQ